MAKFKVMDITTGREVSAEKIDKIAKENGLISVDIDQFFIGEDGQLILTDDCGNIAYCDMKKLGFIPVFEGKYPDLKYLEAILLGNLYKLHPEAFKTNLWQSQGQPQVELVSMFPQTWPDTAGGFSRPGTVAGQAFITQITTVMEAHTFDTGEDFYGVFFDNAPAYLIDHAPEAFFKDLKAQCLKSVYEAKKAY